MTDNQMPRGLNQVLYKYLPDSWIDFYLKKARRGYSAKVTVWNSKKLEGINERRLLETVSQAVNSFYKRGGGTKGFGSEITPSNYDVSIPKRGKNVGVQAEVNPLTFFCSNCKKVHSYKSSNYFLSNPKNQYCNDCGNPLKQIRLVYACECGWAGPVKLKPCEKHGFDNMKIVPGDFKFTCSKCSQEPQMIKSCPECNKRVFPKNALDWGQFIPFSLSLIDLVNKEEENFLSQEEYGAELIIANWLKKISDEKLNNFIEEGLDLLSAEEREEKIEEAMEKFLEMGMPENYAKMAATENVDEKYGSQEIKETINYIKEKFNKNDKEHLKKIAESLLEYKTILKSDNVSTLENAIQMAQKLNTNANPEVYKETAKRFGIKHTQVSGDVPFVFASYGYTRRKTEGPEVYLRAFTPENDEKKNIYATKLQTEGVLFEFDRKQIIKWLLKNKFVDKNDLPKDLNEEKLKIWFMNHVDISAIDLFSEVDKNEHEVTSHVYNLIHSISHAFIRQASQLCGLDKNSLSEYIFPNIPAIFIYCQNSQGFNLGALFNIFEAYFEKWMKSTLVDIEKCIFDPVCIERDKSCSGCIYLNEVSCSHFNKDLNRRYLVGWFDKVNQKRIYGFWEEI